MVTAMWSRNQVVEHDCCPETAGLAKPLEPQNFHQQKILASVHNLEHSHRHFTMSNKERSPSPEFSPLAFGEDLAPLPKYKAAGLTAVDFSGLLGEPLKLHEDLAAGCGGQLWPAGMVLAKHMLRYHRDRLQHARMSATILSP